MKNAFLMVALLVTAILSYRQWQQSSVPPAPPAVVPSPIPEQHLTPEGTFAILDYVSTRTKRGVVGFEPGQMVRFISADADKGTLVVTDGTYQVELKPEQLTNDLDVANLAKRRDQASQQQLRSIVASAQDEDARIRLAADVEAAKNIGRRPSGSQIGVGSKLDEGAKRVGIWRRYPYGSPYYYYYLDR